MVEVNNIKIGDGNPLVLIAGPCVIESEEIILNTAEEILYITNELGMPFIFKSSYKKANRTSVNSFVGLGDEEALNLLAKVKDKYEVPVLTDVHNEDECILAARVADVLQIPAFLCRQTELLVSAGKTGKVINIKKGQFLAPNDMKYAADKVKSTGNSKYCLQKEVLHSGIIILLLICVLW